MRPSCPMAILHKDNDNTYLQLADSYRNCIVISSDTCTMLPTIGSEWRAHEHLSAQQVNMGDTIATPHIYVALPFVQYYNTQLLWVNDDSWRYSYSHQPRHVDYAIITENYNGKIAHLLKNFNIANIVLSENIYPSRLNNLKQECLHRGIPCYDARNNGTWTIIPH